MAAGWINTATATATMSTVNTWYQWASTSTGTSVTPIYYGGPGNQYPSRRELIHSLEADGYVVLEKRRVAIAPRVQDYLNYSADQAIVDTNQHIFYGYVLPEKPGQYLMPDGSTIHVDSLGNYEVRDQDSKVTYKANRVREFNPYLNASDLLEQFIKEMGKVDGVKQTEVLRLPIEAFIYWLILQAAKKDGDSLEGLPRVETALPAPIPKLPRCQSCGRFLSKAWAAMRISFCSQEHMKRFQSRALVPI